MLPLGKMGYGRRDFSVLYHPIICEPTIILNKKFTFKKGLIVQHLKEPLSQIICFMVFLK